jgi:hypothetical protein
MLSCKGCSSKLPSINIRYKKLEFAKWTLSGFLELELIMHPPFSLSGLKG